MTGDGGFDLNSYLTARKTEVEEALLRVLPGEDSVPVPLARAMRYSVMAGGKRLRPILCLVLYETCRLGSEDAAERERVLEAASALELIHTYSLIHDDLPAMDNDNLRRGKPTCHVVHGEAMALLAGDTLQSLGFELLAKRPEGEAWERRRVEAVAAVATAIGFHGMAGGQALDLMETGHGHEGQNPEDRLLLLHSLKTGRLLCAAAELGAIYAGALPEVRRAVVNYGRSLGLLFQIADDILDVTASPESLGKTPGKDSAQDKLTYPAVFGMERSRKELGCTLEQAVSAAECVSRKTPLLAALARFAAYRES